MSTFDKLLNELEVESVLLLDFLRALDASSWELPSTAEGWAIRDQVSHLAYFDDAAVLAAVEPERFKAEAKRLWALGPTFPDVVAEEHRHLNAAALLDWLATSRSRLLETFRGLDGRARVPWFGPDMSLTSSATARFMETWAHGLDVQEAFGSHPAFNPRLFHIAHLGVRTRGFSFALRELPQPVDDVYVELAAGDEVWTWGDPAAENAVTGSALDFCLLVTQRRHRADTDVVAHGPVADAWLSLAQAFAGAPGRGRAPRHASTQEAS